MLRSLDDAIEFARSADGESTAIFVVDWRELMGYLEVRGLWEAGRLDAWLHAVGDPSAVLAPLCRIRHASEAMLRDWQVGDLDAFDALYRQALSTLGYPDASTLRALARDEWRALSSPDVFAAIGGRPVLLHRPRRAAAFAVTLVLPHDPSASELCRSDARYRGIVEDHTDFIVRYRVDGVRTFVNAPYAAFFGGKPEDFVGRSFLPLVAPDHREAVIEKIRRLVAGEADALPDEHLSIRHDGVECWTHWTDRAIRDERGEVIEFQAVGRDLTERKEAEQRLAHAQKMEALGTMAGGLAHDFNNTLASIIGLAELIVHQSEQPELVIEHANAILDATEHASELTRGLLRMSRRLPLRLAPCDVRETMQAAGRLLRAMLPSRIALRIEAPELPPLQADGGQLTQALINLGLNARDSIPEHGTIEFTALLDTRHGEETMVLRVTDDGTGIPEHIRPRLFEPFFTTKPDGQGTGLGLAMVYACASAHRGRVEFDSEVGRGSTFEIRLPASAQLRRS
jgi:PAS domain S-box-containing protein